MSAADDSDLRMDDADEKLADEVDFIALNETINGNSSSYIELERDYHGSFNERNGIQINRPNVVIDGIGHNINSTGQNSRIFNIDVEGITLKNIIFTGGSSEGGGAVYTNKDLTIINCTFMDNQATGSQYGGGAICGNDVKMSI